MTKKKVTGLSDLLERLDGIDESIGSLKSRTDCTTKLADDQGKRLKGIYKCVCAMQKRMEDTETRACKIELDLGDHYRRLQALEGKAPPPVVETVDLRKALMGEGAVGGSGASGGKSCLFDPLSRENDRLLNEVKDLRAKISNLHTRHEIDQDVIGVLKRGCEAWKRKCEEKKGFTIDVVRVHKCVQSHRWVAAVKFDTATSGETTPACPECGQVPLFSSPTVLRYPSGGLAEIKGVGDLHGMEYFL